MRTRIFVTMDNELLGQMDHMASQYGSRSALIEQAVRAFLGAAARQARDSRDLEILNRRADALNAEAADVLGYQFGR